MVEGHSVHRIAARFRQTLVGRRVAASSPNGRFSEGSNAIHGSRLNRMEAVGKNLFAFFGPNNHIVVHVHFGMSGVWSLHNRHEEPDVKATTRLRLEQLSDDNSEETTASSSTKNELLVAHLSCMTCNFGGPELYTTKVASLGMDPLRHDADPDALWQIVQSSKRSIGKLVMDQSFFAGPGNIYRAEILFLAGIHPETLGMDLDRSSFDRVWDASVQLLRRGYDTGSILTVDPLLDPDVAKRGERRYIYNKSHCARCRGIVRSWDISGRTCYACETGCQKRLKADESNDTTSPKPMVTPVIKNEMKQHVPFISHCARDGAARRFDQLGPAGLTVKEIRSRLENILGSDSPLPPKSARKAVYVQALNVAMAAAAAPNEKYSSLVVSSLPAPKISAEEAAREKACAGEHRGVEHVAELSSHQAVKAIERTPTSQIVVEQTPSNPQKEHKRKIESECKPKPRRRLRLEK
jgi:formamidopyrimidine-DNA glycosylase